MPSKTEMRKLILQYVPRNKKGHIIVFFLPEFNKDSPNETIELIVPKEGCFDDLTVLTEIFFDTAKTMMVKKRNAKGYERKSGGPAFLAVVEFIDGTHSFGNTI